jgi:hypothetical protein
MFFEIKPISVLSEKPAGSEAEPARRFDKLIALKAPSLVEGLTLAATRNRSLNCGI